LIDEYTNTIAFVTSFYSYIHHFPSPSPSFSKRDSKLYVNVMAFQQQLWCNEEVNTGISGSGGTGGTTVTLKNDRKKEVLAYYITRVSSAIRVVLEDGTSNTLPGWLRGNREASKGLYSNHIRAAFKVHC
jgi:hypothetical protein